MNAPVAVMPKGRKKHSLLHRRIVVDTSWDTRFLRHISSGTWNPCSSRVVVGLGRVLGDSCWDNQRMQCRQVAKSDGTVENLVELELVWRMDV